MANVKQGQNQTHLSYIRVPNSLIINNEQQNITCATFATYIGLKLGCIDDFYKKDMEVLETTTTLSRKVLIANIRKLEELGYIKCRFEKFPKHKPLEIDIIKTDKIYTTLDRETIYKIIDISKDVAMNVYKKPKTIEEEQELIELNISTDKVIEDEKKKKLKNIKKNVETNLVDKALRYYYMLEMHYNNELGIAFPTYDYISKHGSIAKTYISLLNIIFVENQLITITKGKTYLSAKGIQRENNKYKLHHLKMKKSKEKRS